MASPSKACERPRQLMRAITLAFFVKVIFCIYIATISWNSAISPPKIEAGVTKVTLDGYHAGCYAHERGDQTCSVAERPSLKVHSELPYSGLISLLHDRRPDGSVNEGFYMGMQFTLWKNILPFISWDGERVLKIAIDELVYGSEDSAAFFPLLPWLANVGGKALRFAHLKLAARGSVNPLSLEAPKVLYMGIAGLIITNIAGILAAGALYMLIWEILYRRKLLAEKGAIVPAFITFSQTPMPLTVNYIEKIAYFSVVFFCLGPATVHSTSIYTESIFCLLTFTGLLLLYAAEDSRKLAIYGAGQVCIEVVKMYIYELAAVALFFLGSALRSNGMLLLIPLFFYTLRTCSLFRRLNILDTYDLARLGIKGKTQSFHISWLPIVRFVGHWLRALLYAVIIMTPMVVFQLYLYCIYCFRMSVEQLQGISSFTDFVRLLLSPTAMTTLRNILNTEKRGVRSWCSTVPPRIYSFVQKEYWDVGFLWVLRPPSRLHVFLYCWNAYLVTYFAIRWYSTFLSTLYSNVAKSVGKSTDAAGMFSPYRITLHLGNTCTT
ncbi:hypothetical protein X943_003444 [Babesia divergens]|uniref:GPI mannosyltransferase 2 n=1 Tax=Babesia divergens TaxID=32595 RepID=A0AAD9LKN6_BABDI|nr:hypothetical protein X943_003444 [Babesia divergens]